MESALISVIDRWIFGNWTFVFPPQCLDQWMRRMLLSISGSGNPCRELSFVAQKRIYGNYHFTTRAYFPPRLFCVETRICIRDVQLNSAKKLNQTIIHYHGGWKARRRGIRRRREDGKIPFLYLLSNPWKLTGQGWRLKMFLSFSQRTNRACYGN